MSASTSLYRQLSILLAIAAITAAILLAIRYMLVEPDEVAAACTAQVVFSCKIRNAAIYGFVHHLFGPISVVAAVLAWIGALRIFALVAVVAGIAGMVLYDFDMAGVGMLLGVVLYVRLCLQRMNMPHTGQQAPGH